MLSFSCQHTHFACLSKHLAHYKEHRGGSLAANTSCQVHQEHKVGALSSLGQPPKLLGPHDLAKVIFSARVPTWSPSFRIVTLCPWESSLRARCSPMKAWPPPFVFTARQTKRSCCHCLSLVCLLQLPACLLQHPANNSLCTAKYLLWLPELPALLCDSLG